MTMDVHQLRAFLAVTEQGSLGRASTVLNTSQPALSRLLHRLELKLGVELFERHAAGMEPTAYGLALLPHARSLVFGLDQAAEDMAALRGASRGAVHVGALPSAARTLLPDAIDALLRKHPSLRVLVLEGAADVLATALRNRAIDLAVAADLEEDDEIVSSGGAGAYDEYVVVAGKDHPLRHRPGVTLHDVLCEAWVQPPRDVFPRAQFERLVAGRGMPTPIVAIESPSPDTILAMVARGAHLGWLPRSLVSAEVALGRVHILDVDSLRWSREFQIYRRRNGALAAASRQFLGELRGRGQ